MIDGRALAEFLFQANAASVITAEDVEYWSLVMQNNPHGIGVGLKLHSIGADLERLINLAEREDRNHAQLDELAEVLADLLDRRNP